MDVVVVEATNDVPLMVPQRIIDHLSAETSRAKRLHRCSVLVFHAVMDRLTVSVCMRPVTDGTHDHGDLQSLDWQ